ncbi:uncharacterized protein LOC122252571 [Penaeus japonicus]|uniref:uncharacterized protein LOC122252571 n=1 Tax=Penaeus japonicus TaxID=27405 RepID=UPI001C70FDAB|nr:uncharacterized protein LOC122252571 [Penaeus japonicus]
MFTFFSLFQTRPSLSEKERCLVRRNSSLNTQLSRLQLHVKSLSCENNTLKNKMEVELERPLEFREKERHRQREVQVLKKKNTELATITRKLEEKVRSLEKKTKESPSTERRNNFLARQKEKDAMYEKQLLERDREIQRLKARMKELVRKLTGKNGEITRAQSTLELEQIIRTVAKERLQLERHLAVANEVSTLLVVVWLLIKEVLGSCQVSTCLLSSCRLHNANGPVAVASSLGWPLSDWYYLPLLVPCNLLVLPRFLLDSLARHKQGWLCPLMQQALYNLEDILISFSIQCWWFYCRDVHNAGVAEGEQKGHYASGGKFESS